MSSVHQQHRSRPRRGKQHSVASRAGIALGRFVAREALGSRWRSHWGVRSLCASRPVARLHALSNHTGLGTGSPRLAGRKCLEEREREKGERVSDHSNPGERVKVCVRLRRVRRCVP